MEGGRTATVLIAEPSSDARRNDTCKKVLARAVLSAADATGGMLVSTSGGKVVLRFSTADAAASAASKIHAAIEGLPAVDGIRPGVQIGFHTGPLGSSGGGLADDTINLALKLAEKAQDGQTVISQQTAERLNPAFRGFSRSLLSLQNETRMCELASWHQQGVRPDGWTPMAVLRLTWRDQLAVCSREKDTIVIGRDAACDLMVPSQYSSRRHCTVRHRDGQFALLDHSRNATYINAAGAGEVKLKRSGALLPEMGSIAIGHPRHRGGEVVEFCYALVT